MPTLIQALQLGSERLTAAPAAPHPTLEPAWRALDWAGAKETALLDALALVGTARIAGALTGPSLAPVEPAAEEARPIAPASAAALLPPLLDDEGRALLPEWLALCANRGWLVPPLLLPRLLSEVKHEEERAQLVRVMGERGGWLARQNPAWAWVHAATPQPDVALWDVGTEDERIGCLRSLRANDPAKARELVVRTWTDDPPEFRARALDELRVGLSVADEPFLTKALADRRKDVRTTAQSFLARLPGGGLAGRMRERAERLVAVQRGLLGKKIEVNLPAAFDAAWKSDGIEEKPPAGVGEKAHWTMQILALVPVRYWADKLGVAPAALIELARKSSDWGDLLLGAWYRAATLHGEAEACSALLKPVMAEPKFLPPGVNQSAAIQALLSCCDDAARWYHVGEDASVAWSALHILRGTPTLAQARALLHQIAPALRDGFNPGGSPAAVVAARLMPPSLRDEAVKLLTRDDHLSKPAEAFVQALDLRRALHAAFSAK
jgi:hypothetical protein